MPPLSTVQIEALRNFASYLRSLTISRVHGLVLGGKCMGLRYAAENQKTRARSRLPEQADGVGFESAVWRYDDHALHEGLGDDHAIEGVFVQQGELFGGDGLFL